MRERKNHDDVYMLEEAYGSEALTWQYKHASIVCAFDGYKTSSVK